MAGSLSTTQRRRLSLLAHRHLGLVCYDVAQEALDDHRSRFLAWKALPDSARTAASSPRPLLISFESLPTFTFGRRQDDLDEAQMARLTQRLRVFLPRRSEPVVDSFKPQVRKTSRGGLATYHGPGQLVLWPVIDMHSPLYTRHGVASYAAHLEAATQRLVAEQLGIRTATMGADPGVWVWASGLRPQKIAALGVHHRRFVTGLGVALNVDVAVTGGDEVNPWARIVPCGLEGRGVTSAAAELSGEPEIWNLARLAERWASIFEEGLLDETKRGSDVRLGRKPRQLAYDAIVEQRQV